ncbi:ATP-binding protein [Umezawaea endophytica]|uniref:histidine kinase n=1 Tax=Umezawaea endophytica TaxID=1654476 RepID=A0A9X2VV74_9PSEU|nr:HAMP domain-containing sensor histidine kinase [Umezawaea endophytica]MCS7483335.1 HAMP domain-containing histidine kinase [Umezawaea endophytica]
MTIGLRARLVVAFALVGVITALAVSGGMYLKARDVILRQAQDAAVLALTDGVTRYGLLPPTRERLYRIADELSDRDDTAVAVYGDVSAGSLPLSVVTPELRESVRGGRTAWQRVSLDGVTQLVSGTSVAFGPSLLEVYSLRTLEPAAVSVAELSTRAWVFGGGALVFALLLALLAAWSVLRPVRELGEAARRMGSGDLESRLDVRGSDELAGLAVTFNDAADALGRRVDELRRMEADARRFVADVSHELRTPLSAMTAVADVLEEEAEVLPADAAQAARLVSQETHNLTRLVNDLMEISRFDSGAAALVLDDVDVAQAVRASLRARGWQDVVDTTLPADVVARVDPRRLDVVLANLVGNAVRHGGAPVSVALEVQPGWVVITVTDRGPGLSSGVLPHVFDRFYKADSSRARSAGSGLGLAIARENALLHGGTLVAENHPDGGAVFTLRLPDSGGAR